MNQDQIIQGMRLMVAARDWMGYLHFRRMLTQYPDFKKQLRCFLKSLPAAEKQAYIDYFGEREFPRCGSLLRKRRKRRYSLKSHGRISKGSPHKKNKANIFIPKDTSDSHHKVS